MTKQPDATDPNNALPESDRQPSLAEVSARLDQLLSPRPIAAAAAMASPVGSQLGKYEVRRVIGRGAFGVVYQALDVQLDRDVALKIPRPEVLVDAEKLSRFQSEATAAAKVDHRGIVPVYEADLHGPTPYIASAFCSGPDLGEWLARRDAPVPAAEAARFIAQLAESVESAHQHGVLHRDLKPSNVLLEPSGKMASGDHLHEYEPRLTDFGLAKLLESGLQDTRSSLLVGTPLYMAPEQLATDSRRALPATDVYALGVMLFELLTLRTPFDGKSYVEILDKLRTAPPVQLCEAAPSLPVELQTICTKCLEKEPADRYQAAGELHDDLERFVRGEPLAVRPLTRWQELLRWCRRPERIVAAGWFCIWFHLCTALWMVVTNFLAWFLPVYPAGKYSETLLLAGITLLIVHFPKAWLGRRLVREDRWPFWPSAITSALLLGVFVLALRGTTNPFESTYPTLLSKINTFTVLIGGSLWETGLHLLAIPAWLASFSRSSASDEA